MCTRTQLRGKPNEEADADRDHDGSHEECEGEEVQLLKEACPVGGVSKGTERTCKYRDEFAAVFVAGIRGQQLVEKRHGDIMLGELTGEVEAFLVGEREMTEGKID